MTSTNVQQIALLIKRWSDSDGNDDIEVIPMASYEKAQERLDAEALGEINFWNTELDYHIPDGLLDGEEHYIDINTGEPKEHMWGNLLVERVADKFTLYDDYNYRQADFWIEVRSIEG